MVLVTGGTGLVGTHLLYELTQKYDKIIATKRATSDINKVKRVFEFYTNPDKASELFSKIEWRQADILNPTEVYEALQGVKEVYHCAAIVSFNPKNEEQIFTNNVIGTRNVVNAALEHKVEKFIYTSSVAALGNNPKGETTEETYAVPEEKFTVYSKSKYYAELEVWRGQEEGLNVIIVNPSVILGPLPDLKRKIIGKIFLAVWYGLPFYIEGITGFVDVRDVVKAMLKLSEKEIFGERFIINAENLHFKTILDYIAESLDSKKPSKKISKNIIKFIYYLDQIRSKLTISEPVLTKETIYYIGTREIYSSKKLLNYLPDFKYIPIKDSIQHIAKIFIKQLTAEEYKNKNKFLKALKTVIN